MNIKTIALLLAVTATACTEEAPTDGPPPDVPDAYQPIEADLRLVAAMDYPSPSTLECVPLVEPSGCPSSYTCLPLGDHVGVCRPVGQYLPDLATCSSSAECGPGAVCNQAPDGADRCLRYCDVADGSPGCAYPYVCRPFSASDLGACVW